jgi:hypothetical protein
MTLYDKKNVCRVNGPLPISGRTGQQASGGVPERLDGPAAEVERRRRQDLPARALGQGLHAVDLRNQEQEVSGNRKLVETGSERKQGVSSMIEDS